VDSRVSVHLIDERFNVGLRGVIAELGVVGTDTHFFTVGVLHGDVLGAGTIVTDENRAEARGTTGGDQARGAISQLHLHSRGNAFSIK
jgi:hypothetical protein